VLARIFEIDSDGRDRLMRAADLLAAHRFEFWHYGDSIGLEGLLAASALLGDQRYAGWVHGSLKAWMARRTPFQDLDNTAAGHAMCLCFEHTEDDAVLVAARDLAAFLMSRPMLEGAYVSFREAPLREPHGGEVLPEDEQALMHSPGPGVFVDCLHFDPPFFVHLGVLTGESGLVVEAVSQALAYIRLLQDESGLFWHFWLEKTSTRYGYGWSRGQGWALLGLLDLLEYLPAGNAAREDIEIATRRLAAAMLRLQTPAGGWNAVAHDAGSGTESSTSAFMAAAFAAGVASGVLGSEFSEPAMAAWRDAWAQVDEHGALGDVSAAVWASTAQSHYVHVPRGFVVPWGQGPLLLAALRIAQADSRP